MTKFASVNPQINTMLKTFFPA